MKLLSIVLVLMNFQNEVSVDQLKKDIERFYQQEVIVVKDKIPADAYYKPRNRYRADSILTYLEKRYPGQKVVAITSVDISASVHGYPDWGVFGLASFTTDVSVVSTYRFKGKNLHDRTYKVVMHELGHTYKLPHCKSKYPCMMKAANHFIKNIDREPLNFCPSCNKTLDASSRLKTQTISL